MLHSELIRRFAAFRPKLLDTLPGYTQANFARDLGAGLTVGVVALPLAMAFAIASGLKPEAGLFTAIIAGFLISLLGGSKVQIGGPAGAFIVIVYGILERYGLANLIIATVMSGVLLFLMGWLRLGTLIRFIPISVVIGFTNGIAVLILILQIKDFLGLDLPDMPHSFFVMLKTLGGSLHMINPAALALSLSTLLFLLIWQRTLSRYALKFPLSRRISNIPGPFIALVLATLCSWLMELNVETIGTRFGGIPATLPSLVWPDVSWETARFLLIPALTLALLGAIESLLCARIADGLTGDRHNPNQELMAQGVANFITPFFGGMPATGTIARTVTNIKSGAVSPVAGIVHALTLLLVVLVAAPMARHIPLPVLAAILIHVALNMGDWRAFIHLRQYRMPYRITLLAVFGLTVIVDLTVAVEVGLVAACLTFIYRISSLTRAEIVNAMEYPVLAGKNHLLQAWRLHGALFFGAVQLVENMAEQLPQRALVLDLSHLIYVDSSGADTLIDLANNCQQHNVQLFLCGLGHQPLDIAQRCGLLELLGLGHLCPDLASGLAAATPLTTSNNISP